MMCYKGCLVYIFLFYRNLIVPRRHVQGREEYRSSYCIKTVLGSWQKVGIFCRIFVQNSVVATWPYFPVLFAYKYCRWCLWRVWLSNNPLFLEILNGFPFLIHWWHMDPSRTLFHRPCITSVNGMWSQLSKSQIIFIFRESLLVLV